jgi:chitinase
MRGLLALCLVAGVAWAGVTASGADFVPASHSPGNSFAAATDFNTVAVSMVDPASPRNGNVTLQATASSERGIDRVRFQSAPAGTSTWTDACEDTAAPYACNWDSAGVADGARDMRAIAVDQAGYQRITTVAARVIDNALPSAALNDPDFLTGLEILTATGADPLAGLASLSISYRPAGGGSWTDVCTGATSPRVCPLDTTSLTDGDYELRARSTDLAGNVRDSVLTRSVDNTAPSASITMPAAVTGTVTVPVTAGDGAGSGVKQATIQIRTSPVGVWADLCAVDTAAPFECTGFDTTARAEGLYDLQAIVEDNAGNITTSAATTIRIDRTVPSGTTLVNPGASLQGSVTLSGTATDAASGIQSWTAQYRLTGTTPWLDVCTDTTVTAPSNYSCAWATTGVADGVYELRAVGTDVAGNQTAATTQTNKRVDNVVPTVSLTDPGTPLTGAVTLNATASDGGGIASVAFERSPAGAGTWTNICTDNSAPYTCSFPTTGVVDASYDLRAVATDNAARTASSVVASRWIENVAPFGVDLQTTSGGAIVGRTDAGDTISLTYSEPIAPASVLAGWDGTATAMRVYLSQAGNNDRMDFQDAAGTTRLNLVLSANDLTLARNYVTGAVILNGTMVRNGNTITVTFGTVVSGAASLATATGTGALTWRPSASAQDMYGTASTTTLVTEGGTADADF